MTDYCIICSKKIKNIDYSNVKDDFTIRDFYFDWKYNKQDLICFQCWVKHKK